MYRPKLFISPFATKCSHQVPVEPEVREPSDSEGEEEGENTTLRRLTYEDLKKKNKRQKLPAMRLVAQLKKKGLL